MRVYEILVHLIRLEGRNVVEIMSIDLYKMGVCKCGLGFFSLCVVIWVFKLLLFNFTLLERGTDISGCEKD